MKRVLKHFWLVCIFSFFSQHVSAVEDSPDEAWAILQKSAEAARALSYRGVINCQSGIRVQSLQITHINGTEGEFSRVVMLGGSPREVLSQGGNVVVYNPYKEKIVIEKRHGQHLFPALLPASMEALKLGYQARIGAQELVAGRDVQVVFLDPRDSYRYGYKLWADREYGLLLKTMMLNERKEAIEQITFNQLTLINAETTEWFLKREERPKSFVPGETVQAFLLPEQDTAPWKVGQLPAGYRLVDQMKREVPGKRAPVDHMIFSDGLASVSVFIEPLAKGARPKAGYAQMGSTSFFANFADSYQVVAVGDVPEATVTLIAKAISLQK